MNMNRRKVLLAGAGAGTLMGMSPSIAAGLERLSVTRIAMGEPQQLNGPLLASVKDNMGARASRFADRSANSEDYKEFARQVRILHDEWVSKNADATFVAQTARAQSNHPGHTAAGLTTLAHEAIREYVPDFPKAHVAHAVSKIPYFDPRLPADLRARLVQNQLSHLTNSGLSAHLTGVADMFDRAGSKKLHHRVTAGTLGGKFVRASYVLRPDDGDESDDPEPPGGSGFCGEVNFYMGLLGIVATNLAIMCLLPEPLLVVICPVAAVIGIVVGVLAIMQFIAC
jgi:hypothetical protein